MAEKEDLEKNAPEGEEQEEQRVADSIQQAASMLEVSEAVLKLAKTKGAPGFRGSRVYLDPLELWLAENDIGAAAVELEEKEKLLLEILRERLKEKKFKNEVAMGKFIEMERVIPWLEAVNRKMRNTLREVFEEQIPPRSEGKGFLEIRKINREGVDQVCNIFSSSKTEWIKEQKIS